MAVDYIYATGKRKEATARVFLRAKGSGRIIVNGRDYREYFPSIIFQYPVVQLLKLVGKEGEVDVKVKVKGGGLRGQCEAIRHGLARALVKWNPQWRPLLKKAGFLTRDAREVERKKYGLKKARRAEQYSKR